MKTFVKIIGLILMIWALVIIFRSYENGQSPQSSFAKEIAKESRQIYDDFREGFGMDTSVIKSDDLKPTKDTVVSIRDKKIDSWMGE